MFFATTTADSEAFPLHTSRLQRCVLFISLFVILQNAFWLTHTAIETCSLIETQKETDLFDVHLFNKIVLLSSILILLFVSALLLYGNLAQRPVFYWIYLVLNCLILFSLDSNFYFAPFSTPSTQSTGIIAFILFHIFSMIVIWMAARELTKRTEISPVDRLNQLDEISIEKDPAMLKF